MPTWGRSWLAASLVIGAVGVAVSVQLWAMNTKDYDVWTAMLIGPALFVVSLPILARLSRDEPDRRIARLVVLALGLKLVAALARYVVAFVLYDGQADAQAYHDRGAALAEVLRSGSYVEPIGQIPGTGFIELTTGILYSGIGPTKIGGYLVYSWIGFWGLYLCYRAFATAVPDGDRWLYARLVLLLPSLLFWPSGIGKEAWMMLSLGLVAYGAALLFARRRGAVVWVAAGVTAAALVRPHMALIVFVALVAGYLFRPGSGKMGSSLSKGVGLVALLLAGTVVLSQVESFFGVQSTDGQTVEQVFEETSERTNQGGSSFEGEPVRNPVQLPWGVVSVLFRPFPYEADNVQALAASLEGLLLMALCVRYRRTLFSIARVKTGRAYIVFCVTYALLFVVAFSSFNNFGILTRQRVQVFPFVLVLLALPAVRSRLTGPSAPEPSPTLETSR